MGKGGCVGCRLQVVASEKWLGCRLQDSEDCDALAGGNSLITPGPTKGISEYPGPRMGSSLGG